MTLFTTTRIAKTLLVISSVVLVTMAGLFGWTMAEILERLDEAADQRRSATEQIVSNQLAHTEQLLRETQRQARRERQELRRDLREVLRQLGGDPSQIPPSRTSGFRSSSEGEESEPPQSPRPRPSPSSAPTPKPSPSESPVACVQVLGEKLCIDDSPST